MTETTVLQNLTTSYTEANDVLEKVQRAVLECEVYLSDLQHTIGNGVEVLNIDSYFSNLVKEDEKNYNY